MVVTRQYCQATNARGGDLAPGTAYAKRVTTKREIAKPPAKKPAKRRPLPASMKGFPSRLSEAIEEDGRPDREIAEAADVDAGGLSRWKRGQRFQGIDAASVVRVAKALGVRVGWLLAGEEPKRSRSSSIPAVIERPASVDDVGESLMRYLKQHGVTQLIFNERRTSDDDAQ